MSLKNSPGIEIIFLQPILDIKSIEIPSFFNTSLTQIDSFDSQNSKEEKKHAIGGEAGGCSDVWRGVAVCVDV